MSRGENHTCVTCIHYPAQQAAQGDGFATCPVYGTRRRWDWPATVLYTRDKSVRMRKALIDRLAQDFPPQGTDNGE